MKKEDITREALRMHKENKGKIETKVKVPVEKRDDLTLAYTPGVAKVCEAIAKDKELVYEYTIKSNTVAIISDGSAVLGLGDIGPEASLPVMEGKALLLKRFAKVDAFPICLNTNDPEEIVRVIKHIAPVFGGINLEDIAAPRCFEIEEKLQGMGIPVFHDDQHGTAITTLAALINAAKVTDRKAEDMKITISGAGAAGIAVAKLLLKAGIQKIIICDSKGAIHKERNDLNTHKQAIAEKTNPEKVQGSLKDAMQGSDVLIGVSKKGIVSKEMVQVMNDNPIILAMANPDPEIVPEEAKAAGAAVIGTGRSDYPNQINNVLAFPGIFRGALDARASEITDGMKLRAAEALAACVKNPKPEHIVPDVFDETVVPAVAEAVKKKRKYVTQGMIY